MVATEIIVFQRKGVPYKAITVKTGKEVEDLTKIYNTFLYNVVEVRDLPTAEAINYDISEFRAILARSSASGYGVTSFRPAAKAREYIIAEEERGRSRSRSRSASKSPMLGEGVSLPASRSRSSSRSVSRGRSGERKYEPGLGPVIKPYAAYRRERAKPIRPDFIMDEMPYKFTTGTDFKVGNSKDSLLTAVNNTVAKVSGIPLNAHNRAVIREIYKDEIVAGYNAAGEEFNKHRAEFNKVRNVAKAVRHGNTKFGGPTMKKQSNLLHIRIPNVANPWVHGYKAV